MTVAERVAEGLPASIEGDDRPSAYWEDGVIVLRASSLGSCTRDLVLHLLGHDAMPVPEDVQKRFDAGNRAEPHILKRCVEDLALTFDDERRQTESVLKVLPAVGSKPAVIVRFHPDGVAHLPVEMGGVDAVVECKALSASSISQAQRKGTGSLFGYDWQLSVMMHAYKLPGVGVALAKNVDDPDDYTGELHVEMVDVAPRSMVEIVKRAKQVRDAVMSEAAPECEDMGQYPCPFLYLRPEKEAEEVEAVAQSDEERLALWAATYEENARTEAAAKKAKDAARDVLMEILNGRGGLQGGGWRVTRHGRVNTRFDRKGAEKKHGSLEEFDQVTQSVWVKVAKL